MQMNYPFYTDKWKVFESIFYFHRIWNQAASQLFLFPFYSHTFKMAD